MLTGYLDAFSGASGDMIVGAALDAGADFQGLKRALGSLSLSGYEIRLESRVVSGIAARRFIVAVNAEQEERNLESIVELISSSALSQPIKDRAIAVFEALAEAEAKVHRTSVREVHFHEVGAVDSIVDVVGAVWAFEVLGLERLLVSALPMGSGVVGSRHGPLPIPAPATLELLSGFPVRLQDGAHEMVTPTAAAIIKVLARPANFPLDFEVERVGYGAGARDYADRPNVLRLILGRELSGFDHDRLYVVESNIDDMNPQIYDYLVERLLAAGARDVTLTPTIMKKGRPGVIVSALAPGDLRQAVARELLAETTTLGVRFYEVSRLMARREIREVQTRFGPIKVKVARIQNAHLRAVPEYEDCRAAAQKHRVPIQLVMEEARLAGHRLLSEQVQ